MLWLREHILGSGHPDTINNLGIVLRVRGEYEEAEDLLRRALIYSESELGLEHCGTEGRRATIR